MAIVTILTQRQHFFLTAIHRFLTARGQHPTLFDAAHLMGFATRAEAREALEKMSGVVKITPSEYVLVLREPEAVARRIHRPHCKLTEASVRKIRRLRAEGVPYHALAGMFRVSSATIGKVCTRQAWAEVA